MKRLAVIFSILLFNTVLAQNNQVKINDLYIPNAPGFILGDKSPSSVDKPSTPRAFAISLVNLWQGGAAEVTTFWLASKPRYTLEQWYKKKLTAIEAFNVSVATFKTDTSTLVGAGFRSQVVRIYSSKSKAALAAQEDSIKLLLVETDAQGNP